MKATLVEWFGRAVDQSVSLSELLCLMAWSNGNVRKLSGETVAISGAVEEMARTIQNIASLSANAYDRSAEAHTIVANGVSRAASAGRAMADISESFSGLDQRMQMLGGAIANIGGFAKEIEGISSQTKLLALNATIEAARAGEAGRGFGVVAAEVKALSEETSKTTELIRGQLATLTQVMQDMLAAMAQGGAKVKDGTETFNQVVQDMQGIRSCVDGVKEEISSITHMLTDQQSATDSIARNLTEIARLAAQNETDSKSAAESIRKAEHLISGLLSQGEAAGVPDHAARRLRADHMLWKQQLAECLVGLVAVDPRSYGQRVQPFGPGFDTLSGPAADTEAFRALRKDAEVLSREGLRVVQFAGAGDIGKAIDSYMAMDAASATALQNLAQMERMLA
ncbi:methyl-accepting chemotaxis protein [Prosthecomicrobium sp. N25]|uniref:methyl-accepting chemotaxis protein n=1 Tax=Prosthecomicrobium sp. N25 TaxID=3129254 RepID=UPI003076AAF0